MATNTSGVRKVKLRGPIQGPSSSLQNVDLNQLNAQIGQGATADESYYGRTGNLTPRPLQEEVYQNPSLSNAPMDLSGDLAFRGSRKPGISTPEFDPERGPTGPTEGVSTVAANKQYLADSAEAKRLQKAGASADIAAGVIKAVGGVINAYAAYSATVDRNNFNIQMAEQQAMNVTSSSRAAMLREQTKGKSRAGNAQLAAVARGQAAGGDLAQTAMSNEEVYAAENMMNMEINAMRQNFGIESQIRQIQSSSNIAEINRDLAVSQAIIGGGMQIAGGAASMPL